MPSTPQRRRRHNAPRSTSLLGALKSIVAAPFSWFSAPEPDEEEPMNGKRKQAPAPTAHELIHDTALEDGSSRAKRMRLDSPPLQQQQQPAGYLDPPVTAFQQQPHSFTSHGTRQLSRTMSIDPPAVLSGDMSSKDPTHRHFAPLPVSRDRSMPLMSQNSSSFRMRTSLTPQPSGSSFGPTVRRPDRDASEPPPLTSLMSNPVFVRAPSEAQLSSASQTTTTLGTLSDSRRLTRTQSRQSSALLFGNLPSGQAPVRVSNAAEQALHDLEIYKTPLLPSRLRGSTSVPDMFKQKRRQAPIVLTQEGEDKVRLGKRKSKNKIKIKDDVANESKPYAGAGGMKKLLAKIREEGDEEGAAVNGHSPIKDIHRSPERPKVVSPPPKPSAAEILSFPADEPFRPGARPPATSSLRVGRSKQFIKGHAPSVAARPSQRKFSAAYDDDDAMEEDNDASQKERQELEEAAKKVPVFSIPPGFSFAKDVPTPASPPSIDAKEPPLTSLPFSFAKPAEQRSSAPSPPSERATAVPAPPTPAITFNSPAPTPSQNGKEIQEAPKTEQPKAIPNFFAQSTALNLEMPSIPSTSIFGSSLSAKVDGTPVKEEVPEPASKPSLFGQPSSVPTAPLFSTSTATPFTFGATPAFPKETIPEPKEPLLPPAPPAPISIPQIKLEPASAAGVSRPALFITPPTPVTAPSFSGFNPSSVGTTAPAEAAKPSPFSFGQNTPVSAPAVEAPKPLFGSTTGQAFSFGKPTAPNPVEAPKPPESSPSPFTFGAKPATPPAPTEKPGFSFGATPTPAAAPLTPSFSFGAAAPTAAPSAAPKPFTFGAAPSTPARPATPPKIMDNEMSMDESPTREVTNNASTSFGTVKSEDKPGFSGFAFGAPSSAPSGALFSTSTPTSATSPFSFGTSVTNPFGSAPQPKPEEKPPSSPFAFGQSKPEEKPPSSPFAFGQSSSTGTGFAFGAPAAETSRPSTTGSFTFGATPAAAPSSGFPQQIQASNSSGPSFPFGQSGSAPSSPQPFNSPFSFSAPAITASTSNPFAFGSSQPASPATSNSGLPQPSAPGSGFAFGANSNNSTAAPFSPSTPTSGSGGNLFTIGSASNTPGSGPRPTRRLPNRRGGGAKR